MSLNTNNTIHDDIYKTPTKQSLPISPMAKSTPIELFNKNISMTDLDGNGFDLDGNGFDPYLIPLERPKEWPEWKLNDFQIGKPLFKRGSFGQVYLARTCKEKRIVALKLMDVDIIIKNNYQHLINRETDIHASLKHENIIKMFGYFMDNSKIIFVLEIAPGGDVLEELTLKGWFTHIKSAIYIYQVINALKYLHSMFIIHRDIRPENLLIGYHGEIKVANFGTAVKNTVGPMNKKYRRTLCGSWDYTPPEMLEEIPYDEKVDLWAVGILIHEFLVGESPFTGDIEMRPDYNDIQLKLPSEIFSSAADIIQKILRKNPMERLSLDQILEHPWVFNNTLKWNSEPKKLLPCFDKFKHFDPSLIKKYKAAGKRLADYHNSQARNDEEICGKRLSEPTGLKAPTTVNLH